MKDRYMLSGDHVTINGRVTGSLYCGGSTVTVNGTVDGDILCAGQKVTVNGPVGGDVRLAGQFVEVNGAIGGSSTTFAQDVRFGDQSKVAGDLNGAAQQFTINGTIGRDIAVGGQSFTLNNQVSGNVDIAVQQIDLGGSALVLGNLNYGAEKELSFDQSLVKGAVSYNPTANSQGAHNGRRSGAAIGILLILMLAASAMIIALIMPRFLDRSSKLFSNQMLFTVLTGFAVVVGGPLIACLLLLSVLLAPLGIAFLFGWLAMLCLSGIFFAYWIGSELLRSQNNILVRMLGGTLILLVLYVIPFINALTMLIALIIGSGMIVLTFTHGYKRPNYTVSLK